MHMLLQLHRDMKFTEDIKYTYLLDKGLHIFSYAELKIVLFNCRTFKFQRKLLRIA